MNISVIGLGKLGLCTAACFAAKGHQVIGVDSHTAILEQLNKRQCPIVENGLEALLEKAWKNFSATSEHSYAVEHSDITLLIVPTPSQTDGAFTNDFITTALSQLAPALKAKSTFHIIDIISTVMPTSCETVFIPLLEELTGKQCGIDFGLVYNPEFIALGSVIFNFLTPDMVLIGSSDVRSADAVRSIYASTVDSAPHFAIMNLVNAEITKLSLNCFVTMKLSFVNELAALCEHIPGAHIDAITRSIGADSRVGSKYLTGGLGFAGPCFPRDNEAFQAAGRQAGFELKLSPQVVAINKAIPGRIAERITQNISSGKIISIFGIAYKADTHIIEQSQGIMLARLLLEAGYKVRLHDPRALEEARLELNGLVDYHTSPYTAAEGASAVVLLTNWSEFSVYDWQRMEKSMLQHAFIFDSWRMLEQTVFTQVTYLRLGVGVE